MPGKEGGQPVGGGGPPQQRWDVHDFIRPFRPTVALGLKRSQKASHLLVLGIHWASQPEWRCCVDHLQHFLVLGVRIWINREYWPKYLLKKSTLRQRKGRAPPTIHHLTPWCYHVTMQWWLGEGLSPAGVGGSQCGGEGGPARWGRRRHSIKPSRLRCAWPKKLPIPKVYFWWKLLNRAVFACTSVKLTSCISLSLGFEVSNIVGSTKYPSLKELQERIVQQTRWGSLSFFERHNVLSCE